MPVTGTAFIVGSAAICALPPLNGFASKWCLYQALLQAAISMPALLDRAVCLGAIGVLSAVGALAVACFAKANGVAFLGKPRSAQAKNAVEVPATMRAPQILLALGCVVTGISIPWLIRPLAPVLAMSTSSSERLISPFALIPLWQVAAVLVVVLSLIYTLVLRKKPAPYKTWDCGFGMVADKSQVTADSFAQPIARIFTPVLRYHVSIDISGRDRRHFPEKIVVEPSMVSLLETKVYGPTASALSLLSQMVAKLQAGSIHLYLLYVCIALVVLVLVGTRLW